MCDPWNEDTPADLPRIEARLRDVLSHILAEAPDRAPPTVDMALAWHRTVHEGLDLPGPYYAGQIRNADPAFPCLFGYEVQVGGLLGLPSSQVPEALTGFETGMKSAVAVLDEVIEPGDGPESVEELRAVIRIAALAHGEWVRIHPFANGNGRIARLWANWCALRYGMPPFVRLRPRPEGTEYALAARESTSGSHGRIERVLLAMLASRTVEI